jgi:SAM-dependent methyltransferase
MLSLVASPRVDPCCRGCGTMLSTTFVDLGNSPLCESFLTSAQLHAMEPFFPLRAYVCDSCFLVQLEEFVPAEGIFTEYAYFSSYSDSWLAHAERYVDRIVGRAGLSSESLVVELGSNDGYLLQYFVRRGIPVLGIEPAANVAEVAIGKGIPTRVQFFGRDVAEELRAQGLAADLIVGNNVLAQVPDLNGFIGAMQTLLAPKGWITMEFPHLMQLVRHNQFDTIYHEHFSYFSLWTAERLFGAHGLEIFDVERLPTHGGSLRIYARHAGSGTAAVSDRVLRLREKESEAGIDEVGYYSGFQEKVDTVRRKLVDFLVHAKSAGKKVAGYGAPGKANTLLNYCGVRPDLLSYTVDRNPHKHGMFLPGTHIPVKPVETIREDRPDFLLILPWNLKDEIVQQMSFVRDWGCSFVVPIPKTVILP